MRPLAPAQTESNITCTVSRVRGPEHSAGLPESARAIYEKSCLTITSTKGSDTTGSHSTHAEMGHGGWVSNSSLAYGCLSNYRMSAYITTVISAAVARLDVRYHIAQASSLFLLE